MNKDDRKRLGEIQAELHKVKAAIENALQPALTAAAEAKEGLEDPATQIEEVRDDEQGKFDNMPEGLQQAENGQAMEQAVEHLEAAMEKLEEAKTALEELEEAAGELVGMLDEAVEALDNAMGE